jgi:hypothetical protein
MRSSPLARRTRRLKSGKPPQRHVRLREVSPKRAESAGKPTRPRDTGPDRTTRQLIKERADWHCEVCGIQVYNRRSSIHHRRGRGDGGSSKPEINQPSNLMLLCGTGTTGCHGKVTRNENRVKALTAGWVVELNTRQDPADVPVTHARYGRVFLLDDGTVRLAGSEAA